ncbi:hypothetical protein Skr01_42130 [Sphaerisporangium krabiense]|uniref:Uncharacterized protein n=1 Tax=Sphaerisporangium krabiense TaxID=763782 RepID=A0A7W9DNG2_9ACTN|nr:hypothetical protein [Sphaerisporangium krabiense]MBB5625357.1 hypothetical protein [Sphaerisporangium krabiense]GII64128.1 hypothetical protein Skr01_42130 [Sphaerisporangium krabiense]
MAASEAAQCQADMAAATQVVHDILRALGAVPPMFGDHTWRGGAADQWAEGWNHRKAQLTELLYAVLAEQPHLIARLSEAERRMLAS